MTHEELRKALLTFGLGERASLKEIKDRHRELVKRYHPDVQLGQPVEPIQQINAAYRLLIDYVGAYRFSFSEEEFYEQNPEARLGRQFNDDPLWSRK